MRIVLATNFQILDEERSAFWNAFAEQLAGRGIYLMLLTTNVHDALQAPYLEIPYTLAGFAQFHFGAPPVDGFLRDQVALEAAWQTPENLAGAEGGAVQCKAFFNSLLDVAQPDLVLSWNTLLPQSRILQIACAERGTPCQTIEQGLLPGTLMVDPTGNHLDSSLANSLAIWSVLAQSRPDSGALAQYRAWYRGQRAAKYRSADDDNLRRLQARSRQASQTVLILAPAAGTGISPEGQMMSRRTMPGSASLDGIVASIADSLGDALLIFRDHPINRAVGLRIRLPDNVEAGDDASLYDYLEMADRVVTIGGTTAAYECLVMRKPVMVVGRNMLRRFLPCAYSDGADLDTSLPTFLQSGWAAFEQQADRVLAFLLDHYLIMQHDGLDFGRQLGDLVAFIDGYDSRHVGSDERRSDAILNWIRDLPRESL